VATEPESSSNGSSEFRYLADPLCVAALLLYALNRWFLKPHGIGGSFIHDYLNDLLCLPLFLPVILWCQATLGIRCHDQPPTIFEVLHNWIVFALIYEVVLPRLPVFRTTADAWDAAAYLAGGLLAWVCWRAKDKLFRRNAWRFSRSRRGYGMYL
jgi:hypothetical protein